MTSKLLLVVSVVLVAAGAARAGGGFDGPTIADPANVPDFALHDQNGRIVRLSSERGNVVLLTFMYTRCQGLCPLTATHLDSAALRVASPKVQVIAVTVDPRGDTSASVRRFVRTHALHAEFHYLTGPPARLRAIWAAYHVSTSHYGKHAYHTLYTMLIDRDGRGRVLYDSTATVDAISHDVKLVLR
ncbi:MAG TPA: SCO family protein [Gaiellaceae bacterium]|jgi:protein SCO1/2